MGNITNTTIDFLKTEKDCELITNEISIDELLTIVGQEGLENIVNAEGKRYTHSCIIDDKVHYIKYL